LPLQSESEYNTYLHSEELKKTVDDIVWLTLKFGELYEEKKTKKNVKSFSDIEHLAYRLFAENSNISSEYAEKYTEILIDEFQDTNGLQDAIFTSISKENRNMFMVGDLKQSIYRFRGGDPTIFKKKSRNYANKRTDGKKISLSQNFRSRMQVIKSINALFDGVMSDEVGDVEYKGDETLQREEERECYIDGDNLIHPMNKQIGYNSELYRLAVIDEAVEDDETISTDYAEAAFIADKIRELVDGRFQISAGDGRYRDIEYRDIAILMRSVKGSGEILSEMLNSRGIPSFVQKEEYFERREIKLMLSLISLINNHMQDIPLVAVMRSPIGGFTENELARIRLGGRGLSYYNAVMKYINSETEDEKLRNKCRRFMSDLDRWRGYVKMKSIASLIWTLYEETGIYDFMGALEGGEEAQANLKLLYERAKKYEASGFKGIFNFIRYIERMENRNEDISGAKLVNESHNVVRIMTIHKSKGLEFPVVFLARTTKKFIMNRASDENRIMLHKDLGIGIEYYNYEDMYRKKLMFCEYISEANQKEYLSEEMRLLYVALTRAREKLIVTAVKAYKDRESYEETLDEWHDEYFGQKLSLRVSEKARSYADWIIPAVESNRECWNMSDVEITSLANETIIEKPTEDIEIKNIDEVRSLVQKVLEFRYGYTESGLIPAKTSVTAIKEMEDAEHPREDDPVFMTQKPKFLRGQKLGAQIGTAHHQVMAYIDIEKMSAIQESDYENFVKDEIIRIYEAGQIDKDIAEDAEIIDMICSNVCGFFKSNMGKEVFSAKHVYRERPFEIEISAKEYDPNLDDAYENEKVVVQGIIDLYFVDKDGNIILVDYKTDHCKTKDEQLAIAKLYSKQIELYGKAMEKILKKSVKDKYLYLFSA
ncbi:MAG: UvrD-helicase domain-containing protein, partial [Clostridia bacterium]|nr:UvrD-helicase domain-containing protein [Clostridia bacterium]